MPYPAGSAFRSHRCTRTSAPRISQIAAESQPASAFDQARSQAISQVPLPFDARRSAAGRVHELVERDLAAIPARAHQKSTMSNPQINALLWSRPGQKTVRKPGSKPISAANAVFNFQIRIGWSIIKLAVVPHDRRPIVYERRLHAAQR